MFIKFFFGFICDIYCLFMSQRRWFFGSWGCFYVCVVELIFDGGIFNSFCVIWIWLRVKGNCRCWCKYFFFFKYYKQYVNNECNVSNDCFLFFGSNEVYVVYLIVRYGVDSSVYGECVDEQYGFNYQCKNFQGVYLLFFVEIMEKFGFYYQLGSIKIQSLFSRNRKGV